VSLEVIFGGISAGSKIILLSVQKRYDNCNIQVSKIKFTLIRSYKMKEFQKSLVLGACVLSLVALAACNKGPKAPEAGADASATANVVATSNAPEAAPTANH
jgi:hypothetical protein